MDRGLGGPQSWPGRDDEEKRSVPLPGIEPRSSSPYPNHYTEIGRLQSACFISEPNNHISKKGLPGRLHQKLSFEFNFKFKRWPAVSADSTSPIYIDSWPVLSGEF